MSWNPESVAWPEQRAVLFVHGIGNAKPGDYDPLVAKFKTEIGTELADKLAIYFLYYDDLNNWMQQKVQFSQGIGQLKNWIKLEMIQDVSDEVCDEIADYSGDIIFPVIDQAARAMIRERYLAQLNQIRLDGDKADVPRRKQQISIIAHSMGCFHTYETLWTAATDPKYCLKPATDGMQFQNVILMAPPVQLIRSAAKALGSLIPSEGLSTIRGTRLAIPAEPFDINTNTGCAKNWISITGDCDPVGGFLFRKKLTWAYMDMTGQQSFIDKQTLVNMPDAEALAQHLIEDKSLGDGPLPLNNPHSWDAYIANHKGGLTQWLSA